MLRRVSDNISKFDLYKAPASSKIDKLQLTILSSIEMFSNIYIEHVMNADMCT